MKRIICILIILFIFFLSSCNKVSYPEPPSADNEFERLIEFYGSKEGEYEVPSPSPYVYKNWSCRTFEEGICYINEIVIATYKTSWQVNGNYLHEFELDTNFKGTEISKTFYVPEILYNDESHDYHTFSDILFKNGEKYLLLLCREINQCIVSEYFVFVYDRLAIKMTHEGKLDVENSTMCGDGFYERVENEDIKKAIDENRFIEYLLESTKDNAKVRNRRAILKTLDFQSILYQSQNVVKVKISKSEIDGLWAFNSRRYYCTVKEVYKGDLSVEDTRYIYLPAHLVKVGGTYILALREGGSLSSRNSIYGIEDEENVKAVLAELEK